MHFNEVDISIALIKHRSSFICIQRNKHPYDKYIEFPGGKLDANETSSACIIRELNEELNINLKKFKYISSIKHLYDNTLIKINIFKVFQYSGIIKSNENRNIIVYENNSPYKVLPTHHRILNTLRIPRLLKILTPNDFDSKNSINLSLYKNIRLRNISYDYYKSNVEALLIKQNYTGYLTIDYPFNLEWKDNFDGIHYKSSYLDKFQPTKKISPYLYSASCHNLEDIKLCNLKLFDYILLSPVLKEHDNHHPLGWVKFSKLSKKSYMPTYALGGLSSSGKDLSVAIDNSGYGLAGITQI